MILTRLVFLTCLCLLTANCAVVSVGGAVVGTTASVVGTTVSTTTKVAGGAVSLAIPDGDSDEETQ
ncbi:hypothetical protein [Roseibium litorale]|uniref:Lipoprotein n=1 Tax=Roseibium litorale TaxID=2803841 RepID=A0ABR9CM21_9HYPH|nr:hypothetical protein [Roseibium litorale]MBD8891920.1 hypothetical protein [Roseibium litorale]